jgi:thioredoxin reductase (NADPH)
MSAKHSAKTLILGSGPAGCTAAVYAARAMLEPIMVRGLQPGGQLTITTDVENYPGFRDTIQGPWLMEEMEAQAARFGTRLFDDMIVEVNLRERPFTARGDGGAVYSGETLLICTGAEARWLGLPSEKLFQGAGVSACATCDGFFFRNRQVVVIGGGNTAVEEALFLSNLASKVTVVHRRDNFRAEKILQQRLFANPKIQVVWDHRLEEVLGGGDPKGVTGVRLQQVKTGAHTEIATDGVFIAIGHAPNTGIFRGQIAMDKDNYILTTPGSTATNVPGVFAAGDVQDKLFRQAVTAAGTGCMAALEAEKFLAGHAHASAATVAAE